MFPTFYNQNRQRGSLVKVDFLSLMTNFLTEKKYSNVTSDPSVKDVDFFLDVLEMFQTWLAATREQLAEQKVQNEAHINEITNMLSTNNLLWLINYESLLTLL